MEGYVTKLEFGLTMTLVGMGGTLLSMWALTLVMRLLRRLFPEKAAAQAGHEGLGGQS